MQSSALEGGFNPVRSVPIVEGSMGCIGDLNSWYSISLGKSCSLEGFS